MPHSRLEIMESIDHYSELHESLIFDRSIYRPMCTHTRVYRPVNLQTANVSRSHALFFCAMYP